MKIAILGWGGLSADSQDPDLSAWYTDGPILPIEFAPASPDNTVAPVLCDVDWVMWVPTLWTISQCGTIDAARRDVARRAGLQPADADTETGFVHKRAHSSVRIGALANTQRVLAQIDAWFNNGHLDIDAVVWRDSRATWKGFDDHHPPNSGALLADTLHAQHGPEDVLRQRIRQTPAQIWTAARSALARVDPTWLPEQDAAWISSANDVRLKDWDECRTAAARLDNTLVDVRKIGFSFISALLTAGTFLGVSAGASRASAAAFLAVMVLIAALFSIDTYYQVLLSGAVERALDIEAMTKPPIRITKYLSSNASRTKSGYIVLLLYLLLIATAGGLGIWSSGGISFGLWSLGPARAAYLFGRAVGVQWPPTSWELVLWALVVCWFLAYTAYWWGITRQESWCLSAGSIGWFIGAFTLVWATLGLALIAIDPHGMLQIDDPHSNQASILVLVLGVGLGLYVEVYWFYAAHRSGLYQHKPERQWPNNETATQRGMV